MNPSVLAPSLALLIGLYPSLSPAADLPDDDIETLVVTATRDEQKALEVDAGIGVKGGDEIELDDAALQKELLNSLAGVLITQTGSTLGHMTSIRMPINTGPYYLFLQDGIPLQSSGFFNHNGLAYGNFTTAGSVEVLKGAGTALYGSDSVAATINIRSRIEAGTRLRAEAGSDGFQRLRFGLGRDFTDYSLGLDLSAQRDDGWRDHTASERDEFSLTHRLDLSAGGQLLTRVTANRTDAEMAGSLIGLDALEQDPTSVGDIQSALDSGLEINRKFDSARISSEWTRDLDEQRSVSIIGYLRSTRNRYIATWQRNLPHNDSQQDSFGLLMKMDIEQERRKWILGADLEVTQSSLVYTQLFDYTPSGWGSPVPAGEIYNYDVDYLALAPYLRLEQSLGDDLLLTAGLRYDSNRFDYTNNLSDGQYDGSSYSRPGDDLDPDFDHWSPKLSLGWKIDERQRMYFRYANGFRIPQASRLYSLKTDNIESDLDPEVTDTLEIGYKRGNDGFYLEAALYAMRIDDSIVRRENADGDRYYVNGGETRHRGLELTLGSQLTRDLALRLAASRSQHEYVDDPVYGDNEQASAPKTLANLRLLYRPRSLQGLLAMLEFQHVGEYWLDDANSRSYDGYTVANLKALYRVDEHLQLNLKINNLEDEIYAERASYSYGKEKYTPAAPRQIFVGLEYRL